MDKSLACRLIKASHLVYSISRDGRQLEKTPAVDEEIKAIGLDRSTLQFYQAQCKDSPIEAGEIDDINAYFYGETPTEAILAFRGTLPPTIESSEKFFQSLLDWINDGRIELVKGANLAGLVHKGFLESIDALWDEIDKLNLQERVSEGKSLLLTGHSKGGALMYLAAYRLARKGIPVTAAYSFAAPRPGDQAFAFAIDQQVTIGNIKEICRFEYQDDIVPHLPPSTGSWIPIHGGLARIHNYFPFEAPHLTASPKVAQDIKKFLARLDAISNFPPYASAGNLQFIDWNDAIMGDSFKLATERNLRLATMMAELRFVEIIRDHFSNGRYMKICCNNPD